LDPITTAHHVHDLRTQVAPDLFRRFDARHVPRTTLPALAVAHAAYAKSLDTGETVSFALRDALFEEGLDISRPDVLADIAGRHDVDAVDVMDERSVLDDWHEGEKRGVMGSPHFFCGEHDVFCPSLEISKGGGSELKVNPNLDVLDAFLSRCFKE
jgi:predicted DsbA family dithiol-disulfide isomerase